MISILLISTKEEIYRCDTKNDAAVFLIDYYRENSDVCIGEMLTDIEINGCSMDEVVNIYGEVMQTIEDDVLIHIVEGEEVRREL